MIQYDFNRKSKFEYIRFQIQTNKILSATESLRQNQHNYHIEQEYFLDTFQYD